MPQDFSGKNLRGRSFKSQNLRDANFSHSDIRGANFTNAQLRGASFSYAKAGLQHRLLTVIGSVSLLLFTLSGFASAVAGGVIGYLLSPVLIRQVTAMKAESPQVYG